MLQLKDSIRVKEERAGDTISYPDFKFIKTKYLQSLPDHSPNPG